MKKVICVILLILISLSMVSCRSHEKNITNTTKTSWPLVEVNVVYDSQGNILQQTLYNESTEEFIITKYSYSLIDDTWVCTSQSTTIVCSDKANKEDAESTVDTSINVYYEDDLSNYRQVVIMDNADVKISIIESLGRASWWEFGYKFKVENKSDKVITIMFGSVSIMDMNCKPMFSVDHIDAGHTAYFNLAWDRESLERAYIPYLDNIEFMVRVYDNENWNTPALYGTKVLIKK